MRKRISIKEMQAEFGITEPEIKSTVHPNPSKDFNEWSEHNFKANGNSRDRNNRSGDKS